MEKLCFALLITLLACPAHAQTRTSTTPAVAERPVAVTPDIARYPVERETRTMVAEEQQSSGIKPPSRRTLKIVGAILLVLAVVTGLAGG